MRLSNTAVRVSLERWSQTLFLVAGVLVAGHATLLGVQAFTEMVTPPDLFAPLGHLVALVGLFGLYPMLADRTPTLARAAAAVAAVPAVGWLVVFVGQVGELAGVLSPPTGVLPGVVFPVVIVSTILTYVLFGVTSLRAGIRSRTVARRLLIPAGLFGGLIASIVVAGASALVGFLFTGGLVVAYLAISQSLRLEAAPTDGETPADAAAG
jgi:hypothetical protein